MTLKLYFILQITANDQQSEDWVGYYVYSGMKSIPYRLGTPRISAQMSVCQDMMLVIWLQAYEIYLFC